MKNGKDLPQELTDREREIVRLLADGLSDREIAAQLVLTVGTVKWYNRQIYSKLDVTNRAQAAARAMDLRLLEDGDAASDQVAPLPDPPRNNLPAPITSFVGRAREIGAIKQLLEASRLVTIVGLSGSGKTRLALEVARASLPAFVDGVFFIPLGSVSEDSNILWPIAEHIRFQFKPGVDPLDQLLRYFREKTLLLVLDNVDLLLQRAEVVTQILQAAPRVKILVTAHERLNIYGEAVYPLAGLALQGSGEHQSDGWSEACELFLHRARLVVPHIALPADQPEPRHQISRICRFVEGMPLAIELASSWVDVLPLSAIAEELEHSLDLLEAELRDAPSSQNSMRAVFMRSWNLLEGDQQKALCRLSVFRGGFTREAAEKATRIGLRTLQALVRKSILWHDPRSGRYGIHELIRHYAEKQLDPSEATNLHEAHAAYFADFVNERWPHMKDHRQKAALAELEADVENIRQAWTFYTARRDIPHLVRFLHCLWVIYDVRGWYPAGIELLERGVHVTRDSASDEARAVLGWLLAVQGLFSVAGGSGSRKGFLLAQEGVHILQQSGERFQDLLIVPLIAAFITASRVNEPAVAARAAQTCLQVASEIGDTWGVAKAKQLLALIAIYDGRFDEAASLAHESLAIFESNRDNWSKSVMCIEVFGLLAVSLAQYGTAQEWVYKGLKAAQEIDFKYSMQMAYWQLGYIAALQQKYQEAGNYWDKALGVGDPIMGGQGFLGFGGTVSSGEWSQRQPALE